MKLEFRPKGATLFYEVWMVDFVRNVVRIKIAGGEAQEEILSDGELRVKGEQGSLF